VSADEVIHTHHWFYLPCLTAHTADRIVVVAIIVVDVAIVRVEVPRVVTIV